MRFFLLVAGCLLLALLTVSQARAGNPEPGQAGAKTQQIEGFLAKARVRGTVRVIARLSTHATPERGLAAEDVSAQRRTIHGLQKELEEALAGTGTRVMARFQFIPYIALEVNAGGLAALRNLPLVSSLEEDLSVPPTLASSVPGTGALALWATGYTGAGQVVAVLDTGVDKSHPFFSTAGNKVVSEACYSSNSNDSSSLCPGGVTESTEIGSGIPCPLSLPGCYHGTHVAGIAVGNDGAGPDIGVAKDAGLIAIQVFSRVDSPSVCGIFSSPCIRSFESDQIKALERVQELRTQFRIAAVNMSLGEGRYFDRATCDASFPSLKAAIDNLRSLDIATIVSAGNDEYRDSMSEPACISTAISVGATTDFNQVAWFSNVAPFLDLFAPGDQIDSSVPGGGIANLSGTSMAAPMVAGAWALLRQARPDSSVAQILSAMRSSGARVDDQRSGGAVQGIPRLLLDRTVDAFSGLELVSAGYDGHPGYDSSFYPALSADGRFVAFCSRATNLGAGLGSDAVLLYDRATHRTTPVIQLIPPGECRHLAISADGRYVAFGSARDDLVPGDTNGKYDVFLYDSQTLQMTRVNLTAEGAQSSGSSLFGGMSADGRRIVFESNAYDLVAGDTNSNADVFLRDLDAGTTTRVSVDSSGHQLNGGSYDGLISADGRHVTFLYLGCPSCTFLHRDLDSGQTTRVDVPLPGEFSSDVYPPANMSADGRFVTFSSRSDRLVQGDTNHSWDVFVRDRTAAVTLRASVASDGSQSSSPNAYPRDPEQNQAITPDGSWVSFASDAPGLVPDDANNNTDVFLHDLSSRRTARVSVTGTGAEAAGWSRMPAFSPDGRWLAFVSNAPNLPGGDGHDQIYVRDLCGFLQPVAFSNAPICEGQDLQLGAHGLPGASYTWLGPEGFTSQLRSPKVTAASMAVAGIYTVSVTAGSCFLLGTANVVVNPLPPSPGASNDGPACPGQDVHLAAGNVDGATYKWTGPRGFSSTAQNPVLAAVQLSHSGTYSVTSTVAGCVSPPATTQVLVQPPPTATVSGDQLVCPGAATTIEAALTGEPPWTLVWSDGFSQSGIMTSPATRIVSPVSDTTYAVTSISDARCQGSSSGSAAITIDDTCGAFYTVTPCRAIDTRGASGPYGQPALLGGESRSFALAGLCGIPAAATAVAVNLTVVEPTRQGYLTLFPGGVALPVASTINFAAGQIRANNAIARLGPDGTLNIFSGQPAGATVHVVLDVTGYFE